MITTAEQMIEQYVASWNENNLEDYKREFRKCWAADAVYIDPFSENIIGVDALSLLAHKSLEIIPKRKFEVLEKPEHHHFFGKYVWKVEFSGKTNIGFDYFEFNSDFKITRIVSFFKPDDSQEDN